MLNSSLTNHHLNQETLKVNFKPMICKIVERLLEFLKPFEIQAFEKNLEVKIALINEIPEGMCFDMKIYEEIIFHLMQNAIKFNKKGGAIIIDLSYQELEVPEGYDLGEGLQKEIEIIKKDPIKQQHLLNPKTQISLDESARKPLISKRNTQSKGEKWGYLVTRIIDTGMGIKKEKMVDLFSTFKKKGKGGVIRTEGIGIGFSTARALVDALGGSIYVTSEPGNGTSVTFGIQMRSKPVCINQKDMKLQTLLIRNLMTADTSEDNFDELLQADPSILSDRRSLVIKNSLVLNKTVTWNSGKMGKALVNLIQKNVVKNSFQTPIRIDTMQLGSDLSTASSLASSRNPQGTAIIMEGSRAQLNLEIVQKAKVSDL